MINCHCERSNLPTTGLQVGRPRTEHVDGSVSHLRDTKKLPYCYPYVC
jgi:hypothetical protein